MNRVVLLALLLPCLAGCGYRNLNLSTAGRAPRIFFPVLENLTREPAVEAVITGAISREMLRSGLAPAGAGAADYRLAGRVSAFETVSRYAARDYRVGSMPMRMSATVELDLVTMSTAGPGGAAPPERKILNAERFYCRSGPFMEPEPEVLERLAAELGRKAAEWLAAVVLDGRPDARHGEP